MMGKKDYSIRRIEKKQCVDLLANNHYLSKIQKGFKSGLNFGLFKGDELAGVCIFTGFPVPELVKGCFGLDRNEQTGFFELSRLCLDPLHQEKEHNLASWFVSRCIKALKKSEKPRALLSYADDDYHSGIVYQACNFKYYGLTAAKKDFWILQGDGSYKKHSRGKTKGVNGEWRKRSQKHRYMMIFDKSLNCRWNEVKPNKKG